MTDTQPDNRTSPPNTLSRSRLMAILRADSSDYIATTALTLIEAGVTCLEVTLTTPGAIAAIAELTASCFGEVSFGIGSVLTAAQVYDAANSGARFVVSPAVRPEVITECERLDLACFPGAYTPTEIVTAWDLGASAVKVFPAGTGGPAHIRQIHAPMPSLPMIPTGGIALEDIRAYLSAGAYAVALGSSLIQDALTGGDLTMLSHRARTALNHCEML